MKLRRLRSRHWNRCHYCRLHMADLQIIKIQNFKSNFKKTEEKNVADLQRKILQLIVPCVYIENMLRNLII